MENNSFLYSFLPTRKNLFNDFTFSTDSIDLSKFLIRLAKRTLFYYELITQLGENLMKDSIIATQGYIWLSTTFLAFFCSKTFSLKIRVLFDEFLTTLTKVYFLQKI